MNFRFSRMTLLNVQHLPQHPIRGGPDRRRLEDAEMNSRNSINSDVRLCAALVVGVGTLLAAPTVRNVDCPRQSLGDAVAKADPGDTLRVTGTCHERIVITTDHLT